MSDDEQVPVYTAAGPAVPSREDLTARIPGWGIDLDPAVRPSSTRERQERTGAHWVFPDRQPEDQPRERSIEHQLLPPVFGTTVPPRWLSGRIRRYAYRRFSEARAAHWLLLLAADRVDAIESHLVSFGTLRPDNPITQTGIAAELKYGRSRFVGARADRRHHLLDPVIVAGPWLAVVWLGMLGVRRVLRRRSPG